VSGCDQNAALPAIWIMPFFFPRVRAFVATPGTAYATVGAASTGLEKDDEPKPHTRARSHAPPRRYGDGDVLGCTERQRRRPEFLTEHLQRWVKAEL